MATCIPRLAQWAPDESRVTDRLGRLFPAMVTIATFNAGAFLNAGNAR